MAIEWKPDSSRLVVVTAEGHLLFYDVNVKSDQKGLYVQTDSPHAYLRRDSAELFIKETIPPLYLTLVSLFCNIVWYLRDLFWFSPWYRFQSLSYCRLSFMLRLGLSAVILS